MDQSSPPRLRALCIFCGSVALSSIFVDVLQADEVRFVTENGVTYREVYRNVRVPTAQPRMASQQQVVHRDWFTTEMKETVQTFYQPVTTYQWIPRWQGPWGLGQPMHLTYEQKPVTQWQPYTRTVRVPVTSHRLVAENEIVEAATRVLGFEDRLELVSRTPVPSSSPTPGFATGTANGSAQYGATLRKPDSTTYR